jgi:hypothetical protein
MEHIYDILDAHIEALRQKALVKKIEGCPIDQLTESEKNWLVANEYTSRATLELFSQMS